MSSWRFIFRSLAHHWRINFAVALGVMAATAVLTGALLVGDSVRLSLTELTLDRLGRIDELLVVDRFFRQELAQELADAPGFRGDYESATPVILFPSNTVETRPDDGAAPRRTSGVLVVGCTPEFWKLGRPDDAPKTLPIGNQIVLNESLARDLGVRRGDTVALRVGKLQQVAADSALGHKTEQVQSLPQLEVVDIVPAKGLGRFSTRPSQSLPMNAYLPLDTFQSALEQQGNINAILVAGKSPDQPPNAAASKKLAESLRPTLGDYGLRLELVTSPPYVDPATGEQKTVFEYFSLTSDRLLLSDEATKAAENALAADHAQPVLTYLANLIEKVHEPAAEIAGNDAGDAEADEPLPGIAYSTITAVDSEPLIGPLLDENGQPIGPLADDEIVLNRWAAEYQELKPGDKVRVLYFEPESSHGENTETAKVFTLKAVAPLTQPAEPFKRTVPAIYHQPPTLANDPALTPEVEGITDQGSIGDWEAPFAVDYSRVKSADDEYYLNFRLTPKAYVSLEAGQEMWGSRFGKVTSFRIPRDGGKTIEQQQQALDGKLLAQMRRDGASLGFEFTPVKRQQLAASSGTTPFDALFLGLSMFLIASALMLVALLFKLGAEQRAEEVGTLLAVGLRRRHVSLLLAGEGLLLSLIGGLLGAALGIGYAWTMVFGLRTWWAGAIGGGTRAITTPFLEFHMTPASLAIGYASGVLVCVLTILWSIWQMRRLPLRRLLSGQADSAGGASGQSWTPWATVELISSLVLLALAVGLALLALKLGGEARALAFMGCGASVLTATLLLIWVRLRYAAGGAQSLQGSLALQMLALKNGRRNPSRSTLTIGLIAAASFLIVSISAFRMAPTDEGTGGMNLLAESSQPIYENLNTRAGRDKLLANRAAALDGTTVLSLRVQPGDDASCNNLYQSTRPRVLGVTPEMIRYFDDEQVQHFAWAATSAGDEAAGDAAAMNNPWRVLEQPPDADGAIPVVIDNNTAMYSLHLYYGIGQTYEAEYDDGRRVKFRIAGLLANSVLQGSLLVGEENFKQAFPRVSGYRYFLVKAPEGKQSAVVEALEDRLGDQGFDAVESATVLDGLLAVQNTYLSTFQTLGALGLLLGTFGLATVQLRNVLERRGELALMRAVGFRRARLALMVLTENVALLLGGLGTGVFCAALAVLPHFLTGGASPPWLDLAWMLGTVLAVGLLTGLLSVWATLQAPLVSALRGE
jgi:ABC-type antimicrobial peptide transport system permease subunit